VLSIRYANNDDVVLLFNWANDPAVRYNSFNSEPISKETHIKWFNDKLDNSFIYFLILQKDQKDVGQIRLEQEKEIGTINFSICKLFRNQGLGTKALLSISSFIINNKIPIKVLKGLVKKDNVFSQRAFLRAGFTPGEENEDFFAFEKSIK